MNLRELNFEAAMMAAAGSEKMAQSLSTLSLRYATGAVWTDGNPSQVRPAIRRLSKPVDEWGVKVDAIESPFAAGYDTCEYQDNAALRVLNLAELGMLRVLRASSSRGEDVVDVGCGTGRISTALAADGNTVDASDQTGAYCQITDDKLARVPNACASVSEAPVEILGEVYKPGSFNAATCVFGVLNHSSDWRESLRTLARLVKPGGVVIGSMYGSPDAPIVEALKAGTLKYEPAILVRRVPDGILLGEGASEVLPASFPYPQEVKEELLRRGMTEVGAIRPFIPVTSFYPKDPTPDNIASFATYVADNVDTNLGTKLSTLAESPGRALWKTALYDRNYPSNRVNDGAYFGFVARKVGA